MTSSTSGQEARAGRPRDAGLHQELLEAAQDLLVEVGYDRLTMDAVAKSVGAGRATLYRRWPNKSALVMEAVAALHLPQPAPGTGTLRGDLLVLTDAYVGSDSRRSAVIAGLLTAMTHDEKLRRTVSETIGRPRLAEFAAVITAARDRGEVRPDCDVALMSRIFPGLAMHQALGLGTTVDRAFAQRVVDEVLMPLLNRRDPTVRPIHR